MAFTHLSGPGKEELKRASRGWNLKQQKLVTFSDTTWWTLTDLGGSVSVNRKAISTMCQEVLKHDHWAVVTNLTNPEYKIFADLFKVLGMPRTLQRQLEGGNTSRSAISTSQCVGCCKYWPLFRQTIVSGQR